MEEAHPVPQNYIVLPFADGDYTFKLPIGRIIELQTECNAGIGPIFARLMAGRYRNERTGAAMTNLHEVQFHVQDIREVIRLGLIGGNQGFVNGAAIEVSPPKALQLVRHYVDERPFDETWPIACAILSALIVGYSDPDAQKKSPEPEAEPAAAGLGSG